MALVASETEIETVPLMRKTKEKEAWKPLRLYMSSLDGFRFEAVGDVLKVMTRASKLKNVPLPSISNEVWAAKDELQNDPHNMKKIHHMACLYEGAGQHDQCLTVLMRGWKRAGEIPDGLIRFGFLMKTAELSFGLWKYRQALAVLRDIDEPAEPKELRAYLILCTQVWCNNGDVKQGLRAFQRAIEGEDMKMAIRILAVVAMDLKKVGGYESARSSVEHLLGPEGDTDLITVDTFVEQAGKRKNTLSQDDYQRRFIIGCVVMGFLIFLACLYWLEQRSLRALGK